MIRTWPGPPRTLLVNLALPALLLGLGGGLAFLVDPLRPWSQDPDVQRAQELALADLAALEAVRNTEGTALQELSTLRAALPAFEDHYYDERPTWLPPLSVTGTARAVWRNLQGIPEGGSTLPQQGAKLYLRDGGPADLGDKLRELAFATWLMRQTDHDTFLALYLNLAASSLVGGTRDPVGGADRLALALYGRPLQTLGREDQFLLAACPRGLAWMRSDDDAPARLSAARNWMIETGSWNTSIPSFLDEGELDHAAVFRLMPDWQAFVATEKAASTDLDLVAAIEPLRQALGKELAARFSGAQVRMSFVVAAGPDRILARSGSEAVGMYVNIGSIAKLEPLDAATELLGVDAVRGFSPEIPDCIRWRWEAGSRRATPSRWCPEDVGGGITPASFDQAVAHSVNTATASHVALVPYRLWLADPTALDPILKHLNPEERARLTTDADLALAADLLASLGAPMRPDEVPRALAYTPLQTAWFRYLNARRVAAGLPVGGMPDDPTQSVGNSSRATVEDIATYAWRRLVAEDGSCTLSDTGALLALRRDEGTLRWLASRQKSLAFSGKTGSSPQDDAAVAVVAICLDQRPVTLAVAVRPTEGKLPKGLQGSVLLRGIQGYLQELRELHRPVSSMNLPDWALPPAEVPEGLLPAMDGLHGELLAVETGVGATTYTAAAPLAVRSP